MIDAKSIIKMTKHIVRHNKGYPDKRLMHPKREWFFGLVMFSVIICGGSIFSGHLFLSYQDITTSNGDSGEHIPTYRSTIVQNALEKYAEYDQKYNSILFDITQETNQTLASTTFATTSISTGESGNAMETNVATSTIQNEFAASSTQENLGEIELSF